jgi:hypothetical protein
VEVIPQVLPKVVPVVVSHSLSVSLLLLLLLEPLVLVPEVSSSLLLEQVLVLHSDSEEVSVSLLHPPW